MWLHPRGAARPQAQPPHPGCPPWGREAPVLAQPWHNKSSAGVQPSSESRGRSQPVSGINISCAQAAHLTLFRSSAPGLRARSSEGSSAPPSAAPAPSRRRWGASPALPGIGPSPSPLDVGSSGDGDGVSPGCRCFGVTLLSPLLVRGGRSGRGREPAVGTRFCAAPRSAPYYPR